MTRHDTPPDQAAGEIRWSKRQREVLDLLAQRKTNGEIAEALGISLDGAKYHVREILTRLDLDTREEAAEWWRQQQGLRARMRIVTRRMRAPIAIKIAGGAAAAAAVVGIVFFVWFAGDDELPTAESSFRIAFAVQVPSPDDEVRQTELRLIDSSTGDKWTLGDRGIWGAPSLSPDGERLAALRHRMSNDALSAGHLHVFDVATGNEETVELPRQIGFVQPLWSPDSSRIALFETIPQPHFVLLDREGNVLVERGLAAHDGEGNVRHLPIEGRPQWTADSSLVALPLRSSLLVVDRNGAVAAATDRAEWLGQDAETRVVSMLDRWEDGDLIVRVAPATRAAYLDVDLDHLWTARGTIDGDTVTWRREPGGDVPLDLAPDIQGALDRSWLREPTALEGAAEVRTNLSASGILSSFIVRESDGAAMIAFQHNGEIHTADIGLDPATARTMVGEGAPIFWDVVHISD